MTRQEILNKEAFDKGYKAFNDQKFDSNPYRDGTARHVAFASGWTQAKADHYRNQGA